MSPSHPLRDPRIAALMAAIALVGANSMVLSPLAPAIAQSLEGRSAAQVMTAFAVFGMATAASALLLAPFGDRIGADRALRAALGLFALAAGVAAAARDLPVLALSQALGGIASGVALPMIYGLTAQASPPGQAARTLGVVLSGWTISFVIGVFLAAQVATFAHWRFVYAGFSVLGLGVLAVLMRARFEAPRRAGHRGGPAGVLRLPGAVAALGNAALFMLAFYGSYAYLGAHFDRFLGGSAALAGTAAMAYGAGFGLAALFDGHIDRIGPTRALVPVLLLVVAGYLLVVAAAGAALPLIAACLIWGGFNHFGLNLLVGRLNALAPDRRSAVLGLYSAVTYLSAFAGTLAFRPLFAGWGLAGCAAAGACLNLAVLIAALAQRRARRLRS